MNIAFIIVTHQSPIRPNGHKYAQECIQNIQDNMDTDNYDIILIDNGSDTPYPNTKNILYTYRDKQPGGLIRAWNFGINLAVSNGNDFYVIMNDDVLFNKTINNFFPIVDSHKHKDISFYAPVCNNPKTFSWQRMPYSPGVIKELTNTLDGPHGYFLSFNKTFLLTNIVNLIMFYESKPFAGQEILFHNRIKKNGGRSFAIGDCEMFHSHHGSWRKLPHHITHK